MAKSKLARTMESARNRVKKLKDEAEKKTRHFVTAGETLAVASAFGYANGRYVDEEGNRGLKVGPMPLDALTGAAFHVLAFVNAESRYYEDWQALGNGALSSFAVTAMIGLGEQHRQEAVLEAPTEVSGTRRVHSGSRRMSAREVLETARARRRARAM
jgi:hypothetical protein